MRVLNRLLAGSALAGLVVILPHPAYAQSTGTTQVEGQEEVVVTGTRSRTKGGLIGKETVPKTRSTVTADYLATQATGQTVIQSLNLVPGLNFTNSDPYGSSGGNVRLRGFDGNRISLTVDGVPLNDTGNYAIFTNQQLDPEIVNRATVNTGATDVDSPTASATGGTINLRTRKPDDEFGVRGTASIGSWGYWRAFGSLDTGAIGPWGTTAFFTYSAQKYDKFKGPGSLSKRQANMRIYQDLGGDNFIGMTAHFNVNRNAFYRNLTQFTPPAAVGGVPTAGQIGFYGRDFDNLATCTRAGNGPGAQNDGATIVAANPAFLSSNDNPINPASCTNFFGVRINPSNTGNIRMQSSFDLGGGFTLTVDPSFQYVRANGGGTATISETDRRLRGPGALAAIAPGVDLNGDGDILDTVRFYTPNNTNTHRLGVLANLIWDINDNHTVRLAYTLDYGRHRQTGEWGFLRPDGSFPEDVFGGREGRKVFGVDNSFLRGRDRFSIARLNQIAFSYTGRFMENRLRVDLGVRAPFFERELNQGCFTQNGSSNVYCSTETPTAVLANGNVTFGTSATQFIPAFATTVKYDAVLPNIGLSYEFVDGLTAYLSYAESLSAPRTDSLYTAIRGATGAILISNAEPETTKNWDIGLRYTGETITASISAYMNKYDNRIVNTFDDILGIFVDRNVGQVDLRGLELEFGWQPVEGLTIYGSAAFIDSELKNNVPLSATTFLPTAGKKLVETPDSTFGLRVQYEYKGFTFGVQGKHVSKRWATDVNDEFSPSYTVVDLDMNYDLAGIGAEGVEAQLNVINVFDEFYLGNISSQTNALPLIPIGGAAVRSGSAPTYSIGAPRTVQFALRFKF